MTYSAIRAPVPGVNEPHFLIKAKHFWNPDWCARDMFLQSSDAHLVFYRTIGLLTRWASLDQAAWIGRILGLVLLAVGWSSLFRRLAPHPRDGLWIAWIFLALSAVGNFSGEWIVGGVEAKVFAYALGFFAAAFLLDRKWCRAAACAGLAVSFHPVVGVWSLLAVAVAFLALQCFDPATRVCGQFPTGEGLRKIAPAAAWLLLAALPGLVPALQLLANSPTGTQFTANYIQVFYRLSHHLNPTSFPTGSFISYLVLTAIWLAALWRIKPNLEQRSFHWFIAGTLLFALIGLTVSLGSPPDQRTMWQSMRLTLMKLYPFRLFDIAIPLAVALISVVAVENWLGRDGQTSESVRNHRNGIAWLLFALAFLFSIVIPGPDKDPSRMTVQERTDWLDACRWISHNTPPDALFLTPQRSWAFKWFAERAEYVAFKDCPQDSAGIVEWNRRLRQSRRWAMENYHNGYDTESLQRLCRQTGVDHIIAKRLGPFAIEPIYRNGTYRVYRVDGVQAAERTEREVNDAVDRGATTLRSVTDPAPPRLEVISSAEPPRARPYARTTFHQKPKPSAPGAVSEDWPCFLGPTHNAVSAETRLQKHWPPIGPPVVWEMTTGEGYASPSIQGERLVFSHRVGNEVLVDCLQRETGALYWQFKYSTDYSDRYGYTNGPRASPVIEGKRVYVYGVQGRLFCLDLSTGQSYWKRSLSEEFGISQDFFGVAATPLIEGDDIIINIGARGGPCVAAFNKRTGQMVWGAGNRWGPSYASPVPATVNGRRTVFVFAGGESRPPTGGLICLDPERGTVDFEFPWRSKSYESVNAASPVVAGNTVFISASYHTGSALIRVDKDFTREVVWTNPDVGTHWNTAIHRDGYLYAFDGRNEPDAALVCLDLKSGRVVWRKVLQWPETITQNGASEKVTLSTFRGSLLDVDGHVLCLGELGHLLWLDLTPDGCRELARTWLFAARETWTPPVISHGLLYVCQNRRDFLTRTPPRLICYDLQAETE